MSDICWQRQKIIMNILDGTDKGPKRDILILNAAGGILVGGKVDSFKDGIKYAEESLESGAALNKLKQLIAIK